MNLASAHTASSQCVSVHIFVFTLHLGHLSFLFIIPYGCTFKHTFLTADSNMLQKMGNCLKLPVLRVRSSMSENKKIFWVRLLVPVLTFNLYVCYSHAGSKSPLHWSAVNESEISTISKPLSTSILTENSTPRNTISSINSEPSSITPGLWRRCELSSWIRSEDNSFLWIPWIIHAVFQNCMSTCGFNGLRKKKKTPHYHQIRCVSCACLLTIVSYRVIFELKLDWFTFTLMFYFVSYNNLVNHDRYNTAHTENARMLSWFSCRWILY